ncbi:MAG: hypothetical protein A2Y88_12610 [Chloroflexi bacterium RBG_13_48_10]|nr:MAG: hypothetical protein A2Y88_12610 [Chloroflexi bacterium RBG_13_48_10]
MSVKIRNYHPPDQPAIFEISADTAFFGDPVEAFLEDRSLYNDAFARYYTDHETDYVWVADGPQGVIGCLLGCVDTRHHSKQWRTYIIAHILLNALGGRYKLGRLTARFAMGMLMGLINREEPSVDLYQYPAHLQINVRQGFRGSGVGRRLIDAYLKQLHQLGVRGIHLGTTSHNEAACHLYEKIGFKLLDSRANHYWTRRLGHEVKNYSYGLIIT